MDFSALTYYNIFFKEYLYLVLKMIINNKFYCKFQPVRFAFKEVLFAQVKLI